MNILVVMQGASGSGKSTMAKTIKAMLEAVGQTVTICSTDDQFTLDGVYNFDPSKIGEYHVKNQKKCRVLLEFGQTAIVDNTNIKAYEAKPYVVMAQELGVPVFFVRCNGQFGNVHGVPQHKVDQMRGRLEPLTVEGCLKVKAPWEN